MSETPIRFRWECPVCSLAKSGLSDLPERTAKIQAQQSLIAHIELCAGDGHGPQGQLPDAFDPLEAYDHLEISIDDETSHD